MLKETFNYWSEEKTKIISALVGAFDSKCIEAVSVQDIANFSSFICGLNSTYGYLGVA